jgi:cyanophycinase-like exopeptidase
MSEQKFFMDQQDYLESRIEQDERWSRLRDVAIDHHSSWRGSMGDLIGKIEAIKSMIGLAMGMPGTDVDQDQIEIMGDMVAKINVDSDGADDLIKRMRVPANHVRKLHDWDLFTLISMCEISLQEIALQAYRPNQEEDDCDDC